MTLATQGARRSGFEGVTDRDLPFSPHYRDPRLEGNIPSSLQPSAACLCCSQPWNLVCGGVPGGSDEEIAHEFKEEDE